MIRETKGIVLHSIKYGDSSIICKMFTEEFGLLTFMVNSVRKSKPIFAPALFSPLNLVDIVCYYNPAKEMHRLKEVRYAPILSSIPFNPVKRSMSMFMVEVIRSVLKEQETEPGEFHFIQEAIKYLDGTTETLANYHITFLLKLSTFLGVTPDIFPPQRKFYDLEQSEVHDVRPSGKYILSPDEMEWSGLLYEGGLARQHLIKIPKKARKELLEKWLLYYQLHLGQFKGLKSPEVLEAVMAI